MQVRILAFVLILAMASSALVLAVTTLDVGLLVDETDDCVSYVGWPLLFEVSFANQGAMNDLLHNQQVAAELAQIDGFVASGDLTEAEAEEMREMLVLREIEPVILGSEKLPWTNLVSFEGPEGDLPWAIELLAQEVPPALVLGGTGAAIAWYGLGAECALAPSPGIYEVSAAVSTDGIEALPEGMWAGTSASSPVRVEILSEPALTDDVLTQKWIVFGRYDLYRGAFGSAKSYLLDAVVLDPSSTEAWALLGEAQYALDEPEDALESFYRALDLELERPADPSEVGEPPDYLLLRIAQLQEELGLVPSSGSEP